MAWKYYFSNFNITRPNSSAACNPEPHIATSSSGVCSVTSVGLAALATVRKDPHMMDLARRKYSAALRYLARAVADPAELEKGSTTTASFNLSMFEVSFHIFPLIPSCEGAAVSLVLIRVDDNIRYPVRRILLDEAYPGYGSPNARRADTNEYDFCDGGLFTTCLYCCMTPPFYQNASMIRISI